MNDLHQSNPGKTGVKEPMPSKPTSLFTQAFDFKESHCSNEISENSFGLKKNAESRQRLEDEES